MTLAAFLVDMLAEAIKDAIAALTSANPAEAERQALLRVQRRISDEIARRELGVSDTEPPT